MSKKKRLAYENAVASRDDLLRIYEASLKSGGLSTPEVDSLAFKAEFEARAGQGMPKSGWINIAKELRIIELGCGPLEKHGRSAAEVRKGIAKVVQHLAAADELLKELKSEIDYASALLSRPDPYAVHQREDDVAILRQDLDGMLNWLNVARPPAKFNAKTRRQHRVRLAVLLAPLYQREFEEEAKPRGGSFTLDDIESNDWTRFFQMAASVFWGEASTPDLQAILWEAARDPYDLSDIDLDF